MPALSARAWALGAAWRPLLLICVLLAGSSKYVSAQNAAATAIQPSFAVQPLYVCKMEVKNLPQFEGLPSPEMEAGNAGLAAATNGMLAQWKIFNNGDTVDTGTGVDNTDTTGGDSSGTGGGDTPAPSAAAVGGVQKARKASGRRGRSTSMPVAAAQPPPVAPITAPPAAAVLPAPAPAPSAAAPPPSTARSYIISRPAAASVPQSFSTAAAARRAQHYGGWAAAAASSDVYTASASGVMHGPLFNTSSPAVQLEAGSAGYSSHLRPTRAHAYRAAAAAMAGTRGEHNDDEHDGGDGFDRPPLTSPTRRLFAAPKSNRHVCNKGTATNSTTGPLGKSSFSSKVSNIVGITMADSGVIPADAAIAVGPNHVVHVVNSMVKIMPVNSNGEYPKSLKPGQMRLIPLPDWFGLVASPCDGGYISPSATYDKEVGRFLISAICGGDTNQVLLSVSADESAMGEWILYSYAGEATQGTRMQCINESYPISFHSQVGYNKDGVYLTFIHNCPSNQETATGAMIYALPKWAVYKGATYFWSPVWTAWDIYDAVGQKNNDDYYPGAFIQMQPVIPQRAADVQADVTYFVSDNINWVTPLRRNVFTLAALINTGSLWLYEGANSQSPGPLLVARLVNRGMNCEIQTPDVKLTQPSSDTAAGLPSCQKLDGGAMRPPGVWDGGAVLYANKIYIVDRGPDLASPFLGLFMPTLYWAVLSPSFCVGGPCGPWFGTDWGWSEGWDWDAGTWASNAGRSPYKDPAYYNQVFLFPSTSQPPPTEFIQGRRKLQKAFVGAGNEAGSSDGSGGTWSGPIAGSGQPVRTRVQMLAAVAAAKAHAKKVQRQIKIAAAAEASTTTRMQPWLDAEMSPAGVGAGGPAASSVLSPALMQAVYGHSAGNSSRSVQWLNVTAAAVDGPGGTATTSGVHDRNISAAFFASGGWNSNNNLWQGWGQNYYYYDYYQWWREHYFLRNLYMNLRIPPKVNPCKYYKDWIVDNDITFGAINSKHGVIEFVSQGDNPVGLAAPAIAVRGGSLLITYSYSGPFNIPLTNGGIRAYPGVGYSVIDANAPSSSGGSFNLAQAGAGCVWQAGNTRWGSYSGADVHFPSYKIWTAVEYAYQVADAALSISNAATNINIFS